MSDTNGSIIIGRNPVIEALKSGREIEKIYVCRGAEGSIRKITAMARENGVPVHLERKQVIDKIAAGNNQGVAAIVSEHRYCEIEDIIALAKERGEAPFVLLLDGVEDPHNLGAIIRSAEAAGVHGVIIPKRRSAGISGTVVKAAAGATEYMLCAKVPNIAQAIDKLKGMGLWIGACDASGGLYRDADYKGATGLVIGGEGTGIGKLVKEKCDFSLSIPMKGRIGSLNASNAAAVVMYEVRRQRDGE